MNASPSFVNYLNSRLGTKYSVATVEGMLNSSTSDAFAKHYVDWTNLPEYGKDYYVRCARMKSRRTRTEWSPYVVFADEYRDFVLLRTNAVTARVIGGTLAEMWDVLPEKGRTDY